MDIETVESRIAESPSLLLYVTTTDCSVCKVLRPKVEELLNDRFPSMEFLGVEMDLLPEIGERYEIYAVPTIIGFFQGKEHLRKVRVFGIEELAEAIARPYALLFA